MSIFVNVVNQKMHASSSTEGLVAGSQQFVKFKFNLSDEWDGLVVFAQFRQNDVAYNQFLDEENSAYLPAEIGAGTCTLMLYGSNNTTIGTTNYLTLKINENILVSDVSNTDISVSLYNQLVAKVSKDAIRIDNLENKMSEIVNNGVTLDLIDASVKREMADYLSSGVLANLTIEDRSITAEKLSNEIATSLKKAELAGSLYHSVLPTKMASGEFITVNDAADAPFANMVLFGNANNIGVDEYFGETKTIVLGENLCTENRFGWSTPSATFPTPTLSPITLAVKTASGDGQVNYKLDFSDGSNIQNAIMSYDDANDIWFFKVITPSKPVTAVTFYNVNEGGYHSNRTPDRLFVGIGDYNDHSLVATVSEKLRGIPVTNEAVANYTDANGQMWCCDTIDYSRGKYVRRIDFIAYYSNEEIKGEYLSSTGRLSTGAEVYYILDKPVETDLSADEIAKYNMFHMAAPASTVFNTQNAFLEIEYYVPVYLMVFDAVMKELENSQPAGGASSARIADVSIFANKWVGETSPYSQVVTVAGVTKNSQVDLTPSVSQLAVFHDKDITFVTENDGGVITVYAIGQKPTNDYTIQATITEVIA